MAFLNKFRTVALVFLFVASFSCAKTTKSNVIPLESVDQKLTEEAEFIVKEILSSFQNEIGAKYLLDARFITPKVYRGIKANQVVFYESYQDINLICGDLSLVELYEVRKLPYLKRMCYKLKSSEQDIKEVKLIIDVNVEYNLAGYYLYAVDTKDLLKDKNLLPKLKMR